MTTAAASPRTIRDASPLAIFASVIDLDYTDSQGERRHAGYSGSDAFARAKRGLESIRGLGARSITVTLAWGHDCASVALAD
jgi:hypothetical protein